MVELDEYFPDNYDIVSQDGIDRVVIGDKEDIKELIKELKNIIKEKK